MAASAVLARVAIAIASDKRVQNFLLAIVAGVIAFIFIIVPMIWNSKCLGCLIYL